MLSFSQKIIWTLAKNPAQLSFGELARAAVISCPHLAGFMSSPHLLMIETRYRGKKKTASTKQNPTAAQLCVLPDATVVSSSISCRFLSFKWRRPLGTAMAPVHSYPCHPASRRAWCCEAHTIRLRRIAADRGRDRGLGSRGHRGWKGLASRRV